MRQNKARFWTMCYRGPVFSLPPARKNAPTAPVREPLAEPDSALEMGLPSSLSND